MYKRQNAKCDYCDIKNEDIKHLISACKCDNIKRMWKNLNYALDLIVK